MTDFNNSGSTLQKAFRNSDTKQQIILDWEKNQSLIELKERLLEQGITEQVIKAYFVGSHLGGEYSKTIKEYKRLANDGVDISLQF